MIIKRKRHKSILLSHYFAVFKIVLGLVLNTILDRAMPIIEYVVVDVSDVVRCKTASGIFKGTCFPSKR